MAILRDLPAQEIEELLKKTRIHAAEKGTVFYGAEAAPEVLFLLKSGKVELYRPAQDGKKLTLAIVGLGTLFGEMALVGQRLAGTTAMAIENSVICALNRSDVQSLILERPTVAFRIMEALARRLQETERALQELAFNDVTEKS